MLNIGKLCLDTDFNFRVIREEDNDIDLFIDINYRSLDIDTNGDSFFNSRIQFPYVRSLILRINKESNIMTVHLMRDIDLFSIIFRILCILFSYFFFLFLYWRLSFIYIFIYLN